MNHRLFRSLLPLLLLAAPLALAQAPVDEHDHGPAETHETHPDEAGHDEHDEHDEPTAGRPRWVWPLFAALLIGAAAAPAMTRERLSPRRRVAVAVGLLLAAVLLVATTRPPAASAPDEHGPEEEEHAADEVITIDPAAEEMLSIRVEPATTGALAARLRATGRIIPVERNVSHLSPRVGGRVASVLVRVGDEVEAGTVIGRLDSIDAAEAAAALRQAEAELALARRTLGAQRRIASSGVYTAAPLEQATSALAAARRSRAEVRSQATQAGNEAAAARAELARVRALAEAGVYTTAAVEDARDALAAARLETAGAQRSTASARSEAARAREAVASAEAAVAEARGAAELAETRWAAARDEAERTRQRVATGELDATPREAAENELALARENLTAAAAALALAEEQLRRGEALYRQELISLNDLQARRTEVQRVAAERGRAEVALANAAAALNRQQRIASAELNSRRATAEATADVATAERTMATAKAMLRQRQAALAAAQAAAREAAQVIAASRLADAPSGERETVARERLARERSLAETRTRAGSAVAEADLRREQATRLAAARREEVAEAERQVTVAEQALAREQRLASSRAREQEALAGAERAVRQAEIQRAASAEIVAILGAGRTAVLPIRAPFAGLVTAVHMSVGETVDSAAELAVIVDLDEVYVEADIAEESLGRISAGQLAEVRVRAYPEQRFAGPLVSIGGQLDPETRTAPVRARLDNPRHLLRPEMFAEVYLTTGKAAAELVVPLAALQEVASREVVFVRVGPGKYQPRPVTTGARTESQVAITAGLLPGEEVVVENAYLLKAEKQRGELGDGHAH